MEDMNNRENDSYGQTDYPSADSQYQQDGYQESTYQQSQYQQNQYQSNQFQKPIQEQLQYQYQQPSTELEEPMTLGDWMLTLLIMLIPCVNIVMMFVWAFSGKEKKSKSNYFKASLIYLGILLIFYIVLIVIFGIIMASTASYYYY